MEERQLLSRGSLPAGDVRVAANALQQPQRVSCETRDKSTTAVVQEKGPVPPAHLYSTHPRSHWAGAGRIRSLGAGSDGAAVLLWSELNPAFRPAGVTARLRPEQVGQILDPQRDAAQACGTLNLLIRSSTRMPNAHLSLRLLWMTDSRVGEPDEPPLIVNAVPEPPSPGDLVLPLLQSLTIDQAGTETALQRMLPVTSLFRVVHDPLPGHPGITPGGGTHLLPSGYRVAGGVAEIPPARLRRGRHPLAALRHSYPTGRSIRSPMACTGHLSRRASFGSAWISAVARHSRTN
jgi:hypothetical protein